MRERLRRLRWILPGRGVSGWTIAFGTSIGAVGLVAAAILRGLGLGVPPSTTILSGAWLIAVLGAVVGLLHPSDQQTPDRLVRTHREVPGARTPVAWSYAVVLAAAASSGLAALMFEPVGTAVWLAALYAAGAVAACALAGLAAAVRGWIDYRSDAGSPPPNKQPTPRAYFTDDPITTGKEDTLERDPVVDALMEAIERTWGPAPAFITLEGGWGSGKSSVVALCRERLDDKGWIHGSFSGFHFVARDRLAEAFLEAVGRTLGRRYATADVRGLLLKLWEASRPIADRVSPVGLPSMASGASSSDANAHLRSLIGEVPRPVVIFVEDVDRLTGQDILTLISAVMSVGDLPGFVFVLVMDRNQVETELGRVINDGPGYLRKLTNAAIRVPPPPPVVLINHLNEYLDEVLLARGVELRSEDLAGVPREVWTTLAPTLRHAKHLANAFSAALGQIKGEVNASDVLLLSLLEEFSPSTLRMIQREPSLWLQGLGPENLLDALRAHRLTEEDRRTRKGRLLRKAEPQMTRRGVVLEVVDHLFPSGGDPLAQLRDQRAVQVEYFRRFIERRVAPGKVPDQLVRDLISVVNALEPEDAQAKLIEVMSTGPKYDLLDSLVVLAELIASSHRRSVILAVAKMSIDLGESESMFIPTERERGRALIYRLLELGKEDRRWQTDSIHAAIRESTSLEFARELVGYATREHNGILTEFEAFDEASLRSTLAQTVKGRLQSGLDPFASEPRHAPYILACLRDPGAASREAVRLGRVAAVLAGYAEPAGLPGSPSRLRWDSLCRDFDVDQLRAAADASDPLSAELVANPKACRDDAVPDADA
jgi:hypothetical protein